MLSGSDFAESQLIIPCWPVSLPDRMLDRSGSVRFQSFHFCGVNVFSRMRCIPHSPADHLAWQAEHSISSICFGTWCAMDGLIFFRRGMVCFFPVTLEYKIHWSFSCLVCIMGEEPEFSNTVSPARIFLFRLGFKLLFFISCLVLESDSINRYPSGFSEAVPWQSVQRI